MSFDEIEFWNLCGGFIPYEYYYKIILRLSFDNYD